MNRWLKSTALAMNAPTPYPKRVKGKNLLAYEVWQWHSNQSHPGFLESPNITRGQLIAVSPKATNF